ncbi:MAG: PAS domain-containing protein, partial [Promethearchaeota archaeon]
MTNKELNDNKVDILKFCTYILEHTQDLIMVFNDKLELIYNNNNTLKNILGFNENKIKNKKIFQFLKIGEKEKLDRLIKSLNNNKEETIQIKVEKKEGGYIWLEIKGSIFYDNGDSKIIIMIFRDISRGKKPDKTIDRLNDSEEKYRNMINNLDLGFFRISTDGKIIAHNPSLNKILGFKPEESLIGRYARDFWSNRQDLNDFVK